MDGCSFGMWSLEVSTIQEFRPYAMLLANAMLPLLISVFASPDITLSPTVNCSICWFGNGGRICMVVLILRKWSSAAMGRVGKLFSLISVKYQ